ncbi:MAG: GNAT family N-acetyltransferase [Turicibacter sp.]
METKRLIIREVMESDALQLVTWWGNGEIMCHVGFPDGIKSNVDQLRQDIVAQMHDKNKNRHSRRYLILKKDSNTAIGELSYHDLDLKNHQCSFGIKICELNEQGQGYGEEALRGFLTFLFTEFLLHRIELDTLLENKRAQALYQKVGFKVIGVKRDMWLDPSGTYRSAVLMDMLRDEFLQ